MSFLFRLLLLLALGLAAASAGAETLRKGISAKDQAAWLAVGRLNVMGQGFCTATLVAPDLVLTAAHCLVDKRTHRIVAPDRVNFLAGYRTGGFAAHGQGAEVSLIEGFSRLSQTVSRDMGLVRLAAPLPDSIRPIPVVSGLIPGDALDVLSYAVDRAQLPSLQGACEVLRRSGSVIFTNCEGMPGVSGAPLLRLTEDGPRLAAVASAVSSRTRQRLAHGNIVAIAADPALTDDLLDQIGRSPAAIGDGF